MQDLTFENVPNGLQALLKAQNTDHAEQGFLLDRRPTIESTIIESCHGVVLYIILPFDPFQHVCVQSCAKQNCKSSEKVARRFTIECVCICMQVSLTVDKFLDSSTFPFAPKKDLTVFSDRA